MKYFFLLLLFTPLSFLLPAQGVSSETSQTSLSQPATYAVVVGISNYANGITQLDYAHKDAAVFAEYLKSKAGGSVREENIRLLLNEQATYAAMYDALNWLLETCRKDDLVYFYFSGHGDMENTTIYKLGFLLSYNTPRSNYINNSLRIEDLNNIANTLTIKNQAKVVLITDACHSGKLAGSENRGTFLVGEQLRTVLNKEIRITSCAPDQLSVEDEGWGGGRGVFSYYLVKGMEGLADVERDGTVTLNEIKKYLDSALRYDRLLAEKAHRQTPVIIGVDNFRLATVDKATLNFLQQDNLSGVSRPSTLPVFKPLSIQPLGYFFSLFTQKNIEEFIDFDRLNLLPKEAIPVAFIKMTRDTLLQSASLRSEMGITEEVDLEKINALEKILQEDKNAQKRFVEKLVVLLSDRGQSIINLYLEGDEAEMERRRYYNARSSGYEAYPQMFLLALKLISPDHPLYKILKIKLHYFTGVNARLKMPLVKNSRELLERALAEQKQAFALEENAAYIHNELGILHEFKMDFKTAEKYFLRATQIAPTWAIPWANLSGLYAQEKKFEKGYHAGTVADSLQPDLQITQVNLGVGNEISGNLLLAEEFYRKSIDINARHFLPFERLGYVYMNTTHYAQADSFFYEADKRKKGYHFSGNDWINIPASLVAGVMSFRPCEVDTALLKKDDIMAFFTWGIQTYQAGDFANAERIFKKIIAVDKRNPLVFHYMGKLLYDQQKWEESELMFQYAMDYYLEADAFNRYTDSVIKTADYPYPHDCFEEVFRRSHYAGIDDLFFIATLYESWAHYEEAELFFRKCIDAQPQQVAGYAKLWKMLEKLGRFTETEKIIQRYARFDKERSERELNAFYRRVIQLFPGNADGYYRLGLLLYSRAEQPARERYFDTIIHFPVLNRAQFIDLEIYDRLHSDPSLFVGDKNNFSSPQEIELSKIREQNAYVEIPGTKEFVSLADAIYTPRKDGIEFLSKAADLMTETNTLADIYFKIGNIYVWAGSKRQAYTFFDKSIQLDPENAATRLKLIEVATAIYKNRTALDQLNNLYDNKTINFPNRMKLAEFSAHAGQFGKAKKLLTEAASIHPYTLSEIAELNGRIELLSQRPKQALPFYQDYLAAHPHHESTLYTIARIYAKAKNTTEAWKWLEKSLKGGFSYYWVLKFDECWNDMRKSPRWQELTAGISIKQYN